MKIKYIQWAIEDGKRGFGYDYLKVKQFFINSYFLLKWMVSKNEP